MGSSESSSPSAKGSSKLLDKVCSLSLSSSFLVSAWSTYLEKTVTLSRSLEEEVRCELTKESSSR